MYPVPPRPETQGLTESISVTGSPNAATVKEKRSSPAKSDPARNIDQASGTHQALDRKNIRESIRQFDPIADHLSGFVSGALAAAPTNCFGSSAITVDGLHAGSKSAGDVRRAK